MRNTNPIMAGVLCCFSSIFIFLFSSIRVCVADGGGGGRGRENVVPAMFIFGDSLIDNGNNNRLPTLAKADYFPYGIDFPGGPTGRFSNGYTMVDEIAELLGLPLVPPYEGTSMEGTLRGVNYASAAAGILDATGRNSGDRIPFNQQIQNFERTLSQLTQQAGGSPERLASFIGRSIVFTGFGSNDYLNNYLMPNYQTRLRYNPQQFADLLIHQYALQLRQLYNMGARKFVISAVGVVGCLPSVLAQTPAQLCSEPLDMLVRPFNQNIREMVQRLNVELPSARFIFVDVYDVFLDILRRPALYGFSVVDYACCGNGANRGQITCLPLQPPCASRDQFIWWDAYHPTQAANILLGRRAFEGDSSVVFPMNIKQLAELEISPSS